MRENLFTLVSHLNYIDFGEVKPEDRTLDLTYTVLMTEFLSSKGGLYFPKVVEHRAKLHDDAFNFMNLSPSKDLSYFNINENILSSP